MKRESKLTQKQQEQLAAAQQQTQSSSAEEFSTVEHMLRHDSMRNPIPPRVKYRLSESLKQLPPPSSRGWWRRFFGG